MKKRIFLSWILLLAGFAPVASAAGDLIVSPGEYFVISPGTSVTFKAEAKFGTPCFSPPYYSYEWHLNETLIGVGEEFSRNSMDFGAGEYTLSVKAVDCVGREAVEEMTVYAVDYLAADIVAIEAGGTTMLESDCFFSACDETACSPEGSLDASDSYGSGRTYVYNRTSALMESTLQLTFDGSLLYEITDPKVTVLFPSECVKPYPVGLFTLVQEKDSGIYYMLVGEDDFMGGLETAPLCRNVCNAFLDDFIPIVSDIVMCGATSVSSPERIATEHGAYTEVVAVNGETGQEIHFIFADEMNAFLEGRWTFDGIKVESGISRLYIDQLCLISRKTTTSVEKCMISFKGMASGGLPPYKVKWVSSGDGLFDEYRIAEDGGVYELLSTPPLMPPLSDGVHDIYFHVTDSLGMEASDVWHNVNVPWCCAYNSVCTRHWPGRDGLFVNTGNEVSYSCDIYEVCRPELWERAREALYCCKTGCGEGCHKECKDAYEYGLEIGAVDGVLTKDGLKKCAGLYLINGFGPAEKYMTDYFWPEICCYGDSYCLEGCCTQDLYTCTCAYHAYTREVQSLPCTGPVSSSPKGWRSDIAMNRNSCVFSELGAYASMEVLNTGTCCDYANALATMLRILGYGHDEVYAATGPGHCYVLVKFPQSPKWNIIETTGNWKTPYTPYGISGYPDYPYCSYFNCRNDNGMFSCPSNGEVWGC